MKSITGLLFLSLWVLICSCGVNSNLMFKSSDGEVITDDIPIAPDEAYRLAPDDRFIFTMTANDGKRIIDMGTGVMPEGSSGGMMQRAGMGGSGINYLVRPDGIAELPLLGEVKLSGMTIKESQDYLASLFSKEYESPYVQLEITNRRVIVFPGSGGEAKVVPIANNNTTLLEAIALAGGITDRGKAKKIKVMRKTSSGRKIYEVDLSTMKGIKYADMIVQANDYIYVEPTGRIARELLSEVAPILSLITSTIVVISVVSNL